MSIHYKLIQLRDQLKPLLKGESLALMLFGSVARGDAGPQSDTDILQVCAEYHRAYRAGAFSVSVYTPESLTTIAANGSLFALHLLLEGAILEDAKGILAQILAGYSPPKSYKPFFNELRSAINLLNISESFYSEHFDACNKISLFLLRSVLFAKAAESGRPTFSLMLAASNNEVPQAIELSQLKYSNVPVFELFNRCRRLTLTLLKCSFDSEIDSVESLISNAYGRSDLTVALGLRLIGAAESHGYANGLI